MAIIHDDLLKRSYGGMYCTAGGASQNTHATAMVYTKVTQFTVDGQSSDLVFPDHANDRIQVAKPGIWLTIFTCMFNPGSADEFYFQAYAGAIGAVAAKTNVTCGAKVQAPADLVNVGMNGFVQMDTDHVIEIWVASTGNTESVDVKEMNLTISRFSS